MGDLTRLSRVNGDQFYGIDIEEFPARISSAIRRSSATNTEATNKPMTTHSCGATKGGSAARMVAMDGF
jgi:hypothetical protein